MQKDTNKALTVLVSICGMVAVLFIAKITGMIDISWGVVFLPFWLPIVACAALGLIVWILVAIYKML